MRLFRLVMRSGAHVDVLAKVMIDELSSDTIDFYHDETKYQLAAKIKRAEVAGLILMPSKSSALQIHR